jgi:hypothetical protein
MRGVAVFVSLSSFIIATVGVRPADAVMRSRAWVFKAWLSLP